MYLTIFNKNYQKIDQFHICWGHARKNFLCDVIKGSTAHICVYMRRQRPCRVPKHPKLQHPTAETHTQAQHPRLVTSKTPLCRECIGDVFLLRLKISQICQIWFGIKRKNVYSQNSLKYAKNMPIFMNMPNAKILQPSSLKYAKFVFSGRKQANLATLVLSPLPPKGGDHPPQGKKNYPRVLRYSSFQRYC